MALIITFGGDASVGIVEWANLGVAGITLGLAIWVTAIARSIRTLEWYKSQNDAWNFYNAQKLGAAANAFAVIDDLVSGRGRRVGDRTNTFGVDTLEVYELTAVLFQRLNILERDFKAIELKLVDGAGGYYLINEIRANGRNRALITRFMIESGYDPAFTAFYETAGAWFDASSEPLSARAARGIIRRRKWRLRLVRLPLIGRLWRGCAGQ